MKLRLNGEIRDLPPGTTVAGLLETLHLSLLPVLVEVNGTALLPREFPLHFLKDGDVVELIRMVAGG